MKFCGEVLWRIVLGSHWLFVKAVCMVWVICWIRCGQGGTMAASAVKEMYTPWILRSVCGGCSLLCFMWKPRVLLSLPKESNPS